MQWIYPVLLSIILLFGCSTEPDKQPIQFIVKVDSMSHQSFGATGDTIAIHLFGTIGPDGCYSFCRFEDIKKPLQLDLTVWGQRTQNSVCPDVMVYLNGKQYNVVLTQQGWYFINIHQPNGSIFRDSLIVK